VSLPPLRAPREHGSLFAEPPLDRVGELLQQNLSLFRSPAIELLGTPLSEVRRQARQNALGAARAYFAEADEPAPRQKIDGPWLLAGHQPEVFHPGVWVKNFALAGLARKYNGLSLNLVVDNDTAKATRLRVPAGDHVAQFPFDHWQDEAPYEERTVLDEDLFAGLPGRLRPVIRRWPFNPLLPDFWDEVLRQAKRTPLLGERIAAARRTFERRWGCHQYEVPLSRLCRTEAFALFAGHLLEHLPRLHADYNKAVQDYRQRHGLRSLNHPVPDLAKESDWLEAPFWAWRPGQTRRARLFVRRTANALALRAGSESWPAVPLPKNEGSFLGAWQELQREGFKVRTRALTTTLFARLCLADLFMHGIGGGKYDELTDVLLERFFGVPAPGYLVLSATLLLPLPRFAASREKCQELAHMQRDLWYNPQRHLNAEELPAALVELAWQKQAWIDRSCSTHHERRERFLNLRRLNEQLRAYLHGDDEKLRHAAQECREHLHINEVLGRRDYAFCLYPEEMLRPFYERLTTGA
jgi:hypothetical protein